MEISLILTPRRYNPCWVFADPRSCLQSSLSLALALQFLTPNFSASFVTPLIYLWFGLPARLLPSGLSKVIFLHRRLSCICITCPAHLSLVFLIVVTWSASSYKRYSSLFCLDLHTASSHVGPYILLNIFLSKTPRHNSSTLLRTQVSAPYIRTGVINVFYIVTLCFLFIFLALSTFIIPKYLLLANAILNIFHTHFFPMMFVTPLFMLHNFHISFLVFLAVLYMLDLA